MKFVHHLACVALATFAGAGQALGGDDEDPAALLRKAAVAQDVDRDAAKALEIYRKVVEIGGTSDAARDALFKIGDLCEAKGDKAGALDAMRSLTERFAARLGDDAKRLVHENMLRLVPPGTRARSPLGEIYVRAAGALVLESMPSPLDAKIDALLAKLDDVQPNTVYTVQNDIRNALVPVGRDAMGALERAMMAGKPQRAPFAAQLYAQTGQADAVPGLERALREGDGFTRGAALQAFSSLGSETETNATLVAAVERLLLVPELAGRADALKAILWSRLPVEALMTRHRGGGADGTQLLQTALRRKAPGALERTLELIRSGGPDAAALASTLAPLIAMPGEKAGKQTAIYPADAMDRATLVGLIDVLIGQGVERDKVHSIAQLARLAAAKAPPEERDAAALAAWRLVDRIADPDLQGKYLVEMVGSRSVDIGPALADPTLGPRVIAWLPGTDRLPSLALSDGPVWDALLSYLEGRTATDSMNTLQWVFMNWNNRLPPTRLDARWLDLLAKDAWADLGDNQFATIVVRAAARSGKSAFVDLLRRRTLGGSWSSAGSALFGGLSSYAGPGRRAYALDALKDPTVVPARASPDYLVGILAGDPDPETRGALVQIAGDRESLGAPDALGALTKRRERAEIVRLVEIEAAATSPAPEAYRTALIGAVETLHLREAIGFLLREFKEGLSAYAAHAMDSIRAYHERLSKFESWSKGEEAGRRDLAALLKDDDPEIRRAAALSIAAMGDTDALPTLVKIAKDDKDPRVRAAVFAAVERLAEEAAKRGPKKAEKETAPADDGK